MDRRDHPLLVEWSCRVYACLLSLLPGSFRQDFARPMLQAFRDLCFAAWQARGALGLVPVWAQALPDLAYGAAGEWRLALIIGGSMERISVRTSLLLALVACAALLAFLIFPPISHAARYVAGLLALVGFVSVALSGWRSRSWRQAAPGSNPAAVGSAGGGHSTTRSLLIGLELALLALIVYVFRFLFPSIPGPVVAHREVIDPNLLYGGDFQVGIALLGAYLGVTFFGARGRDSGARLWTTGVTAGGAAGLAAALLAPFAPLVLQVLVLLASALLAGLIAGRLAGQTEAGALGGFWFGLAGALVLTIGGVVLDLTHPDQLAGTAWASSHSFCQGLAGTWLAACTVAGDLRNVGLVLLGLPILSGGLGAIGGFLGAAGAKERQPVEAAWGRALVAPVAFCVGLVLLFVARTFGLLR